MLAGAILFLHGWQHLRVLAFPLLFLLLMVPLAGHRLQPDRVSAPAARLTCGDGRHSGVRGARPAGGQRDRSRRHEPRGGGGLQRHPIAGVPAHARHSVRVLHRPAALDAHAHRALDGSHRDCRQRRARDRHRCAGALLRAGGGARVSSTPSRGGSCSSSRSCCFSWWPACSRASPRRSLIEPGTAGARP